MMKLFNLRILTNLKLWQKVLISMLLGIIFGYVYGEDVAFLRPVGIVFINMIKMVVVPLIFFSILNGVASINDAALFGRIGTKALIAYITTTVFAVIIGLSFAVIFEPGVGVNLDLSSNDSVNNPEKSVEEIILAIIPSNPIKAMADGNTVQIVVFAFFTGFALILIGDRGQQVKDLVFSATQLVFKMIELVIKLTPYGVFAIMSWVVGHYGIETLFSLLNFVLTVIAALSLQYLVFGFLILIFAKLNPIHFYKKMLETQALALATVSSKATLPTAMRELRQKLGVSKQSAAFILPLGASMNMDGAAIYLGICAVFFAQVLGIDLTFSQYLIVILTSTIGSIGAAGFPGGSMVMMGMVLSSVGLPLEGISLILGVDRVLEMLRTVINITGDCTVTVIVDNWEKSLNRRVYYSSEDDNDLEDDL
jgi:Na+/H+-dicarboxylate symporter